MKATNLHELVITQVVDKLVEQSAEQASIIRDAVLTLDFDMTPADSQFLVRYVLWRVTKPTSPAKSK
jgi:hypothetical protein